MNNEISIIEAIIITFTTGGELMMGLFAGMMIFSLILSLIYLISYIKIFKKAGKPGWACIVPIYSNIVMLEIAKLPLWYIILFFIPIANIYVLFKINIEIAKNFGKSSGFGVGMTLLPIIFVPLLAFSDSIYEDTKEETTINNSFDATNVINSQENANVENVVEETIPTDSTQIDNNINVVPTVEENVLEPVITEQPTISIEEVQNEIPTFEPTININQNIVEPVIEEQLDVVPEVSTFEPQVEEVNNITPNAFNSVPITNNETDNIVTEKEEVLNNVVEETIVEPINNIESPINTLEQKKLCKNCGNELPSIVSICPNCGTDNE